MDTEHRWPPAAGPTAELAPKRLRYAFSRLATRPQLTAVIDCLFGLPARTQPAIVELACVDERLVFARIAGERGFRHYVGPHRDLTCQLLGFVDHLGLGVREREYVLSRLDGIPRRAGTRR